MAAAVLAVLGLLPEGISCKDKKNDPDEIGDRDVGKGVNFYSLVSFLHEQVPV